MFSSQQARATQLRFPPGTYRHSSRRCHNPEHLPEMLGSTAITHARHRRDLGVAFLELHLVMERPLRGLEGCGREWVREW